ncbi:MAG TPA: pyridoxamine 5'-phosphate oxidase family protein [Sulfuricella sp.]|nr:pyridoxamine 5'-phosphate oxidase family protein [Sulfuricella sp.]
MAKFFPALDDNLKAFIAKQHIFFVATAPNDGRISLSPKGLDSLRVLDDKRVAYLDLTGSGNETAAHLLADGRMTMMFCSFEGDHLILRLYGRGRSVKPNDPGWAELASHFPKLPGTRQIILLEIESLQTACGAGVPLYAYTGEREALLRWVEKKGEAGVRDYQYEKNRLSIDGLPTGLFEE